MHKQNIIFLAVFFTLAILVTPTFAAFGITEVQTPFNFLDVGNATAQVRTLWAVVNNTSAGAPQDTSNSTLVNVTFIFPFGINPVNSTTCNVTTAGFIGALANTSSTGNNTFNLTHTACSVGPFNLTNTTAGAVGRNATGVNVTIDVRANMSALAMSHIAAGANIKSTLIYAVANATIMNNGSTALSAVSSPTQHNSTSFWINPRPYAYSSNNGTVYIMGFNQTRNGYVVDSPIMQYNASIGRPEFKNGIFANVMYMNATFMDAPSMVDPFFMELFSYNLTFRIIIPFANETTTQTYFINPPAAAGNQTLMPMEQMLFTVGGMMGENFTMSMGIPNPTTFDIFYGVNSSSSGKYSPANLTTLKGITISYVPTYTPTTPMLNITATNITALNNTDISILFTLVQAAGGPSSPVFLQSQQLTGFDMTAPPKFGENITNSYIINVSNALDNYTLSNLSIRFMIPNNVSILNGTALGNASNITNSDNSSFKHSSGKATYAYSSAWDGAANFSKSVDIIDRMGRGMVQGTTVRINFTFVDANLNMPQFNRWIPGNQTANTTFVTLNLTTFMSFPVMSESNNTPGTAGSKNSYNATIQMPQKGRMNLTDKVPGLSSTIPSENIVISIDGQTTSTEDGNITLGSMFVNNLDSGTHTISVSYTVPAQSTTGTGGGTTGGGGGAAGTTATVTPESPTTTVEKAIVGTTVSLSIQVTAPSGGGGGSTTEAHKMEIVEIVGTLVRLKFTSEPVYVNVNVGETKYVDINGDGVNDVRVTVNSVSGGVASVTVELLAKAKAAAAETPYVPSVSEPETPTEETTEAPTGLPTAAAKPISPKMLILVVGVLIAILAVVYLYSQQSKEQ